MLAIINRAALVSLALAWLCLPAAGLCLPAAAQTASAPAVVPNFFDPQDRFEPVDLGERTRLRFLTVTDFPPFSYVDGDKQLVGYHVELARALCERLGVEAVCEIQAVPFDDLERALADGEGDAIMAGLAITANSRERLDFTRPYFRLPARFVARASDDLAQALADRMAGRPVAVVRNTAHAAFLQRFFPQARPVLAANDREALTAVAEGKALAWFGDALRQSRLLRTPAGRGFAFGGGAYTDPAYFGRGLAIAVPPNDDALLNALDGALVALNENRTLEELYLRHFPIGLF